MPTKILLVTMIKNESRILYRLLNSVKGKVDGMIICDTGSTDNTVELARTYLRENDIPGSVYEFPFINFGKSRTKSFQCAQEWVNENGWNPETTWCLLLDGDMMLEQNQFLSREDINKVSSNIAGISLKQANGSLVYSNVRVIRCSEPWICKGATHEAWTCPPGKITTLFETPVLADKNDGGCKSDKYSRDVRLLLQDLEEMPNDARTLFYLGQTYLCMHDWENAIKTLRKRIEVGGWDEETYIAYKYLGECLESSGKKDEAVKVWLDGWQYRQHRSEIPMKLITFYRNQPKSQFIATMYLEKLFEITFGEHLRTGVKVGEPLINRDLLFVNKRDVEFHIWEELMILAFYTNLHKQAFLRLDELDVKCRLNWHDFNALFGQLHWYDWVMKQPKTRLKPKMSVLPWADEDDSHIWQPFNPSIRQNAEKTGYELNLRYANYWTNEAKHYQFRGFEGQVLTRNLFTHINPTLENCWNKPVKVEEIIIDPSFRQDMGSHIKGMEDCRLIQNSNKREFLGTSKSYADVPPNKIFHVWQEEEGQPWKIRQLPLPSGVSPGECQKNWMGFRDDSGKLCYIYSFTPFRICDEDGVDRIRVDTGDMNGFHLKEWRGSAGPVSWRSELYPEERYLCVMHKVQIGGDGRWYYHRFMTLDKEFKPSRVSCFVRMTKERVEYWSGMCQTIGKDSYQVVYGCKDSEAYISEIESKEIEKIMFYNLQKGNSIPMVERMHIINY